MLRSQLYAGRRGGIPRIEEHILPLENGRMQGLYGVDSEIKKVMIIYKEFRPGRFTIVLIKEPVGF